jgi:hypothetical protein
LRDCEIVVPGRSWGKILARKVEILAQHEKRHGEERIHATTNASLRSENGEMKSAVEMPPRGKRGKLKNPSFPLFPPGLEIRPKTQAPDFHISTAPAAGYICVLLGRRKEKPRPGPNFS